MIFLYVETGHAPSLRITEDKYVNLGGFPGNGGAVLLKVNG